MLRGISSLSPGSSTFLEVGKLTDILIVLQCDIVSLSNEIQVLKPMLKQSKSKDLGDLSFEVLPLDQAFSKIIYLAIGALTIPVFSTTTERAFTNTHSLPISLYSEITQLRLTSTRILNTGPPPLSIQLPLSLPTPPTSLTAPKTLTLTPFQHYMRQMIFNNSNPILDGVIGVRINYQTRGDNSDNDENSLLMAHQISSHSDNMDPSAQLLVVCVFFS
ncbi:unnamed protein product [Rotaria magnacalcarata]|uniref:HAT C-terminal dimerisation domain-containing protein n=1 Tax=Rotaria magnacalcarata TaxID=392030 RepID=A0A816R464_9BILA|nr:unnamed protein product [Rotaria magnacalcarata]